MRDPKISRHSSGQARVRIGGQTYYLGVYGSREARAKYRELLDEYRATGFILSEDAKGDATVAELLNNYRIFAESHYGKASSEFQRIGRMLKRVVKRYGKLQADKFGYSQFEVVRQEYIASGVGRNYVNENMERLIRVFKWGASRELVPPDRPAILGNIERLKRGRTTAPEARDVLPVDPLVVQSTLPHLPPVVKDLVVAQSLIGCRPGELCALKPGMIDRSGDVWQAELVEHKNAHRGKARCLYIGPKAQEVLMAYLLRGDDDYMFSPIESEKQRRAAAHAARKTPLGYGNRPGVGLKRNPKRRPNDCYDQCSYRRAVHRASDKAFPCPDKLSDAKRKEWQRDHRWSPNQLRHTFGTNARRSEGLEAARLLLGHSDVDTSLIYAEADKERAIEAARRIG